MWKNLIEMQWSNTMVMCTAQFCLTENMPLWQEPMCSELGPLAVNTAAARAILQGTYAIPEETNDFTKTSST
jgi:hypothetical protein